MTSEPLNQYTEICRDAIKSSSAKVSKTFENLLLEISLLMLLSSCHGNSKRSCHENSKRLFPSKRKDSYLITYSKNEIVVESDNGATHFIYKNGEYFTSSFGSDSIVFFSTVKDYRLKITSDTGLHYKIIIEKGDNGVYKTTTYLITDKGCDHPTISYSYDSNYKILQVEKLRYVVYK